MAGCDVAIIGAGPYGLSLAAHLNAQGVDLRVFGNPMYTWRAQMPKGMRLKSDGFASNLHDMGGTFTLGDFCQERGIPYADMGNPVALDTFSSYGMEFQKRFVANLENKEVILLRRADKGFEITLADGETFSARKVVMAVGISHFGHVPPVLATLPHDLVTHSSEHHLLDRFAGKEVIVVGAGSSALDIAALLLELGASAQLVSRAEAVKFHNPPGRIPRPLLERLKAPTTGLGPGWRSLACTELPQFFRYLPEETRTKIVRRHLGPAPGWFVRDQVEGKMPFNMSVEITQASAQRGRVNLEIADRAGARKTLAADHVIAATGYQVDLRRLAFLDPDTRAVIGLNARSPWLSPNFESSLPGLYFIGTSAAQMFGPLMRFAYGAGFTTQRLYRHLSRQAVRKSVTVAEAAPRVQREELQPVTTTKER